MASGIQKQEMMQGNQLRKQLAVAVRSIQWSYAIFWSIKQQGVLEWIDGYYNGDIKTRKTMQPMELNVDKLGLKRSEQLKELYECLAIGETGEQAKRPSASLSPEDLSDAEWYFLVCMSFTFAPGTGLPGRAFATGQNIWLSNAQNADSKYFTRSLLAKSASVQTVVCFPMLGGVIELGTTELVMEDSNLLQHMKTVFLEFPKHFCSEIPVSSPRNDDNDEDLVCEVAHDAVDTLVFEKFNPVVEYGLETDVTDQVFPFSIPTEDFKFDQNGFKEMQAKLREEDPKADSPSDSSDESETHQQTEDSFMMEGVHGTSSQVQSWQYMDDDFTNCVPISMNSSDRISQTSFDPEKLVSAPKKGNTSIVRVLDLQERNHTKLGSLDLGASDLHYTRTLSAVLGNTNHLIVAPCSDATNQKSSFTVWRKGIPQKASSGTHQKMLKKILLEIPLMYGDCSIKPITESVNVLGGESTDVTRFLLDNKHTLSDPFLVLRSLVPSMSKVDKESVLGDTIEYLKDLERRVDELESRGRKKSPDVVDNYDITDGKTLPINKRKACDIDELDPELDWVSPTSEITVCIEDKEATIEMCVPWRNCLLLEIMDAINNLQLDVHSVKSSTSDGILSLSLKSKFRGAGLVTEGMIKSAIERVVSPAAS